ncbi:DUF3253 domain-containing protein [Roseomonas sp. CECT 9278]|uniref:DUF3253 domain-containing protein n=1 Tax=Roseomonas sp. CECT 9278 TaxID=2845823 RepID=UPI001E54A463|nr:DUF3253 domain-containing protein [Roseomonas sp. CECT 9278]CAH0268285.1 hypothetical protein ROS9278_03588 [Roseomonas sp. CECT 9278]
MSEPAIRDAILAQTAARGCDKSICPSEVARALEPERWQPLMPRIRHEAAVLAREGRIDILRKGKPVDPHAEIRGVIRLRARP